MCEHKSNKDACSIDIIIDKEITPERYIGNPLKDTILILGKAYRSRLWVSTGRGSYLNII